MDQSSFLDALGTEIPAPLAKRFFVHASFLLEKNHTLNLTALRDPEALARKLYYPSWKAGQILGLQKTHVLDLGTGAGFPGVPLALAHPDCEFVLLDSIQKKIRFVADSISHLKIRNAQAICDRAEQFLKTRRFPVVVAQAVKPTRELLRVLQPVRRSFSQIVLMKGKSWEQESTQDEEKTLGFERSRVLEFSLPGSEEKRFLLCFQARPVR